MFLRTTWKVMNNVSNSDVSEVPNVETEGENGIITHQIIDDAAIQVIIYFLSFTKSTI